MRSYPTLLERVALSIGERRAELGLSLNDVERISGVSRGTIARIERGARVGDDLVVRVAASMLVLELHAPVPELDDELAVFARTTLAQPSRPVLARPPAPTLGGAA